jgi:hypothetical protein
MSFLFADTQNRVRRIDGSVLTRAGASHTAQWESFSIVPRGSGKKHTLIRLILFVQATNSGTLPVDVSTDGGVTWPHSGTAGFTNAPRAIQRLIYFFNVTGDDLRFRVNFNQSFPVLVTGFLPRFVERGDL